MKKSVKKSIKIIILIAIGYILGISRNIFKENQEVSKANLKIDKYKSYYKTLNMWMYHKNKGNSISSFFKQNNYKEIGIYGVGELAARLIEELSDSEITIKYGIDKHFENLVAPIKVVGINDNFEKVDVLVVTAMFDIEKIRKEIGSRITFPMISIEDIVYSVCEEG